jgi:two-component system, OmpR family, sensor histidine kinase BaeS
MHLRLVHTLSLWLLAAVGVSVLAMGGVSAWHLREGFSSYLQARDLERLDKFVLIVADSVRESGGITALQERRVTMPMLLNTLARQEGDTRQVRAAADAPPPGPRLAGEGRAEGPRAAGPRDAFGARVALFNPDGSLLIGRPLPPGTGRLIERPVQMDGRTVALVRLRAQNRVADEYDVRFLRSQYLGIAGVAAVLMVLALGLAAWLSRQWARPLAAVKEATARIARGELKVRVPLERADEIGDVVRNVNLMAESLQRMEGARRRWVADISHELRTPLTGLRGEVEALVDGVRPFNQAAALSLREEVLRLGALVEDLHLLSMADLHRLPCEPVACDASVLVKDVVRRFQVRAEDRGLTLRLADDVPPALPVHWDAARMTQLLGNLLENSLRYTDAPGRIELGLAYKDRQLVLSVDDSSPGVADADLQRLFEPLFRADTARGRHNGGSGLGLAICEAIAQAHDGHITAKASRLGGLQVTVTLPAVEPERAR